jgi:hypothetical protein
MTAEERTKSEEFADRIEAELGYEVDLAEELGEDLGWFCLELILVCEGEEFEGDVDFNLTESGVEPLYAEITVPLAETERRAILHAIGERIISAEGEETYKYEPTDEELAPLLEDLHEIHSEVFG